MNLRLSRKQIVIIVVVAIILGIAVLASLLTRQGQEQALEQTVAITLPEGITLDIYELTHEFEEGEGDQEPIMTLTQSQDVRLRQGSYVAISEPFGDYQAFNDVLVVSDDTTDFNVQPDYNQQKLRSLRAAERSAIVQAISAAYPQLPSLYTIEEGRLYKKGDWYATKLTYKGSSTTQNDTLRLVAHKQDGTWELVTTPPGITVSTVTYPSIPDDVAADINNFR